MGRIHYTIILTIILLPLLHPIVGYTTISTTPPLYTLYWSFTPDKGFIYTYAWSHDGSKVAILVHWIDQNPGGRILIYSDGGRLLWDSGSLDGVLFHSSVQWSPDDRMLAVMILKGGVLGPGELLLVNVVDKSIKELNIKHGQALSWNPRGDSIAVATESKLSLLSINGSTLWSIKVSGVKSITWNPRGGVLAAWTSHKLLLISGGKVLWSKDIGGEIKGVLWDPSGRYLAVGAGKRIIVFNRDGGVEWSIENPFFMFQWSPTSPRLVVAGINLTLYDMGGDKLWSLSWVKSGSKHAPTLVASYLVSWNPGEDQIVVVKDQTLYIVDSRNGLIVWSVKVTGPPLNSVSWNSRGDRLTLLTGGKHGRLLVFGTAKGYGVIEVKGCNTSLLCTFTVNDGNFTVMYNGVKEGVIKLYATPGEYRFTFTIGSLPGGVYIGDLDYINKYNETVEVRVEKDGKYTIETPIMKLAKKIIANLAQVKIKGREGTLIRIIDENGYKFKVKIGGGGEVIVYLKPGTYQIEYASPGKATYTRLKEITVEKGITMQINIPAGQQTVIETRTSKTTQTTTHAETSSKTSSSETTNTVTHTTVNETTQTQTTSKTRVTETVTTGKSGGGRLFVGIGILVVLLAIVILLSRR